MNNIKYKNNPFQLSIMINQNIYNQLILITMLKYLGGEILKTFSPLCAIKKIHFKLEYE